MQKTTRYSLTFLAIMLVAASVGVVALHHHFNHAKELLWESKMESGRREIREISMLLTQQLQAGIAPQQVVDHLQRSIVNTDTQSEFICMYDREGVELCHPDPTFVGTKIEASDSRFAGSGNVDDFLAVISRGQSASGIRSFPVQREKSSQIVSIYPVEGTDWMLASHFNVAILQTQLDSLYRNFLVSTLAVIFLIATAGFLLIRWIYRKYERDNEIHISGLNEEINSLSLLNRQLENKQQISSSADTKRKRIITYHKDEIITLDINDIAFFYLSESIVYLTTFQRQEYSHTDSLDELMKQLNPDNFYRANRQYIIHLDAIESIIVYGRNQLQLKARPQSPENIIISKNKVAEFKKWLDR